MERNRSKKAKSLGAARQGKAVTKQQVKSEFNSLLHTRYLIGKGLAPPHAPIRMRQRKQRWAFSANFTANVTQADMHNQFLVATTSTALSTVVDCWRIKKIKYFLRNNEADYSVQVIHTPVNVDPTNNNCLNSPPKAFGIESQSSSQAVTLEIIPGPNEPIGMWHIPQSGGSAAWPLFNIQTSSGGGSIDQNSFMEITFEYLENLNGTPKSYTVTGSGLTAGQLYGSSLAAGVLLLLDQNKAF